MKKIILILSLTLSMNAFASEGESVTSNTIDSINDSISLYKANNLLLKEKLNEAKLLNDIKMEDAPMTPIPPAPTDLEKNTEKPIIFDSPNVKKNHTLIDPVKVYLLSIKKFGGVKSAIIKYNGMKISVRKNDRIDERIYVIDIMNNTLSLNLDGHVKIIGLYDPSYKEIKSSSSNSDGLSSILPEKFQ